MFFLIFATKIAHVSSRLAFMTCFLQHNNAKSIASSFQFKLIKKGYNSLQVYLRGKTVIIRSIYLRNAKKAPPTGIIERDRTRSRQSVQRMKQKTVEMISAAPRRFNFVT